VKQYTKNKIKVPRFKEEHGFYTTKARSELMKKIRSKNTKPEIKLRKTLWSLGLRYRINDTTLPGSPDISFKKYRLVIFIDGEFWHGYNWGEKKAKIKKNRKYWIPKIERNILNDKENNSQLEYMGYKVFRFWAQEIDKNIANCLTQIIEYIDDYENY